MARFTAPLAELTDELRWQLGAGGPPTPGRPYTEAELREAWALFGEAILAEPHEPGWRPWAFWEFEADRPEHLLERPRYVGLAPEDYATQLDAFVLEPIRFLADNGYLSNEERETLLDRAREARARIGTDRQLGELRQSDSGAFVWIGGDRTAAAIGEMLLAAGSGPGGI